MTELQIVEAFSLTTIRRRLDVCVTLRKSYRGSFETIFTMISVGRHVKRSLGRVGVATVPDDLLGLGGFLESCDDIMTAKRSDNLFGLELKLCRVYRKYLKRKKTNTDIT